MNPPVILFGGYGVFGSWLARELNANGIAVTIAGRDLKKAEAFAKTLPKGAQAYRADVNDFASSQDAIRGHAIAVHCAGPFSENRTALLDACLVASCHYVDIADDRAYLKRVRGYRSRFAEKQISAVYGCSSLPGISGALAVGLKEKHPEVPQEVRVILFIGNRNRKGAGAIESVFKICGRSVATPQGETIGLRKGEPVDLPKPFGKKSTLQFESADYDLLPEILGTRHLLVQVSFELDIANRLFSALSHLPRQFVRVLKFPILNFGRLFNSWGSEGGGVQVEFYYSQGRESRATLDAPEKGQRLAILPAAAVIQELLNGKQKPGVWSADEFLGATPLLQYLTEQGCQLKISTV